MNEPRLTVVIGANGAGKTTWARRHREALPKPFYNADSIAEGLGDANDAALQRTARKLVDERIERDLDEGNTFGFEITYSGRSRRNAIPGNRSRAAHGDSVDPWQNPTPDPTTLPIGCPSVPLSESTGTPSETPLRGIHE